uniref:Uncharacterized protein n=1 Tax=Strigamia maritima TaxID=126957 RepID=T1IKZ4_STRMM
MSRKSNATPSWQDIARSCDTISSEFAKMSEFFKQIGNLTYNGLVATGSPKSIMGEHLFKKTGYSPDCIVKNKEYLPSGPHTCAPMGEAVLKVEWGKNQVTPFPFKIVAKEASDIVLGWDFQVAVGLVIDFGQRVFTSDKIPGLVLPYENVEAEENLTDVRFQLFIVPFDFNF